MMREFDDRWNFIDPNVLKYWDGEWQVDNTLRGSCLKPSVTKRLRQLRHFPSHHQNFNYSGDWKIVSFAQQLKNVQE